jgi:hypothetical protein
MNRIIARSPRNYFTIDLSWIPPESRQGIIFPLYWGNHRILPPRWQFSAMASHRIHKTRWFLFFRVFILQPWTPDSPLDRCIHTDFGNIVHEGRYRRDFITADGVAINGNGTPDPQNKVSSRYRVYILQAWTHYLPFDRFVNLELGYIVHEGQYRRDFAIVDDVGSTLVLPKSIKQGEFWLLCIHFANRNHVLTSWSMYPHGFWKYSLRRTISTDFVIVDNNVVVFLVVRCSS